MVFGIEHMVLHPRPGKIFGEHLGLFDGDRADQNRTFGFVQRLHFFDDGFDFFLLRLVDQVVVILADHGHVGRNHHDVQVVDFFEFRGFRISGAGHSRQLFVHAEIILERNGGQRLVLLFDLDLLLGLQRLMQSVAVTSARHHPSGKLIDNNHLTVFHQIIHVALKQRVGAERLIDMVNDFNVARFVQVLDVQQFFNM